VSALWALLRKECYHILRDRRTLAVLIFMPIVQVVLFGYSIRTDVTDVRLVIVDPTPDATTLALRDRFNGGGVFRTVAVLPTDQGLGPLFERDTAQVAVEFPPNFGSTLAAGDNARILIVTDATEPNGGIQRQAFVTQVVQQFAADRGLPQGAVRIVPSVRSRFNPTRASTNLFVPGLMAMVLNVIAALMTALSLTREKETGTMEALLVSPLRPWQIIVGKVAPYLAIGFVSVLAVLVTARVVFHVPMQGSLTLLLGEGTLFILVALALGILISARTSSQRVAMLAAMLGTMLPTQMLSGFVFPIESMPRVLQWLSIIVPARWFVTISRGIMLKGVGLTYLWRETLVLAAMTLVLLVASARSFNVRLQ
jgi:ABC-2 type transport system permease protein